MKDQTAIGDIANNLRDTPTPSNPEGQSAKRWKTADRCKTVLEIVAIPFAIGYAIVTYYQWRDQNHSFAVDQRAWLDQHTETGDLVDGKPFIERIRINNFGKTAAVHYDGYVVSMAVTRTWKARFTYEHGVHFEGRTVVPNEAQIVESPVISEGVPVGFIPRPVLIDLSTRTKIGTGEINFVTFGKIDYEDIFGGKHWFTFCEANLMTAQTHEWWPACVRYTDIDRN